MSDRWLIFKDGQSLGPFTPEEIRQSLREGTFDPFDLVAREGSSLRRELVEVDELFFTSKVIYAGEQASAAGSAASGGPGAFAPSGQMPALRDMTQASQQGSPDVGNGHLALASSNRATLASQAPGRPGQQNAARKRRRDPKRFHVMDPRGRVLGPVSAGEIQALFYKGVLDTDVKVMRDGSRAQVPVARFVAIYSENNRVKRAMQQGAHPMVQGGISRAGSMPMPRVAMGRPASSVSWVAIVAIVAALLFGGIAAYVFFKQSANWSAKERPAATRKAKLKKKVKPLPEQAPRPTVAQKKKAERLADLKRQRAKLLELKQRREARDKKLKNKNVRTVAARAPKPAPKPTPPPKPTPLPVVKPAPQSPAQPLPKAPATPAALPKPQGKTVASLTDGQQVEKLGPMSFDKNALADCEGSCNLMFSGAGGSVKVAFFKQVWGPALEAKSGGVYLSGLVKKNGASVKIILSNVQ